MDPKEPGLPDNTATRTALWRALHMEVDGKPHIIEDDLGLKLISPDNDWRQRPDMHPQFTKRLRASIVARARFIEDLMIEQYNQGIGQYVILGAGLDTFAQRRTDITPGLEIFEIDRPETQSWKRSRLEELGFKIQERIHFVPVDFEISSWREELIKAGFDPASPAVVACTGVSLYLTVDAIHSVLDQVVTMAPGSMLAMTFYLPIELLDEEDQPLQKIAEKGAREAGTPFISFFQTEEVLSLARESGFKEAKTISTKDIEQLYFKNRSDGLMPASGEVFLVAAT